MEKINFKHVTFTYPLSETPALNDITFSVEPSEFIVLCGKSGCGKSTLLRHVKKSLMPYGDRSGEILYDGKEIEKLDDRQSAAKIGFVQQSPDNQIVTDKVWHELAFGLENLGLPTPVIRRRVAEMSSYFGIQDWFRKDIQSLSGGQKQLLNLASVMVMQPDILVLDEPTSQLDPIAASDFLQTLYKINRDLGTTILLSEHRLEDAFPIADRVMVMDAGKIAAFDTPGRIGYILAGSRDGHPHPMFYGLPVVMRIFENLDEKAPVESPLTVREGRIRMEALLKEHGIPAYQGIDADRDSREEKTRFFWKKNRKEKDRKDEAIVMKDLWFRYERDLPDVLRGLSAKIYKGEWYCLMGGNGSGKSTAIKAICHMLTPQRGSIEVGGIPVNSKHEKELFDHRLGMVPQNPQALFTEITVEEELLEGMTYLSEPTARKIEKVEEMLKTMEILHLRRANPYDLSGGEQQRLAIGKVLLLEPSILMLDEPTKGLDPFFKRKLAEILGGLRDKGMTIFMVSHDIEFCASYADRCALFFDGQIASEGSPKQFFAGNNFYTTAANKIIRKWQPEMITGEEVRAWLKKQI